MCAHLNIPHPLLNLLLTKGFSPILLLDDVFEKLDETRMNNLLKIVCIENRGQVFITDTHKSRLLDVFEKMQIKGQIIEL